MLIFSHGARMCACPRSCKRQPGTTGARCLFGVGVFVGTSPSAAGISRWYARAQCAAEDDGSLPRRLLKQADAFLTWLREADEEEDDDEDDD